MAYILINDILDELREENNRLFNENKLIYELLDKYRIFSLNFQKSCICNQKSNNDFVIKSLEYEFQTISNERDNHLIKTEETNVNLGTSQTSGENVRQNMERHQRSNQKKVTEDMDSDYEVNDGNDRQFSDEYEQRLNRFVCSYEGCGQRYDRNSRLSEHIRKVHTFEDQLKCNECKEVFVTHSELKDHHLVHSSAGTVRERPFPRSKQKKSTEELDSDYEANNGSDTHISEYSEEVLKKTKYPRRRKKHLCPYLGCGQTTVNPCHMTVHIRRVHTFEKPFKCEECDKEFFTNYLLKDHQSVHSGVIFECKECHKVFATKSLLTYHQRIHSSDEDNDSDANNGSDNQISDKSKEGLKKTNALKIRRKACVCTYPGCGHRAEKPSLLKLHIQRKHTLEKPFKCQECDKDFFTNCELKDHQSIHLGEGFECQVCHKVFGRRLLLKYHMYCHKKNRSLCKRKKHLCPYPGCGQTTVNPSHMTVHVRRVHTFEKPFKCEECGEEFFTNYLLKEHQSVHSGLTFECEECHKVLATKSLLIYHRRIHSSDADNDYEANNGSDNQISGYSEDKSYSRNVRRKVCVCTYPGCGHRAEKPSLLKLHIQLKHTLEKPFKCEECNERFVTSCKLKDHQSIHLGEEFECQVCHKVFGRRLLLKYHTRIHKDNSALPFLHCHICDYKNRDKRQIKRHLRDVHMTTEPTFKCDYEGCHKAYKTSMTLKQHKKDLHSTTQWKCDWPGCDAVLRYEKTLRDHRMSHGLNGKPFKCDFEGCDRAYSVKKSLVQHKRFHELKFVCSWPACEERFARRYLLEGHMNQHLNVRPFNCTVNGCEKAFFNRRNLGKHRNEVHKIKVQ